MPSPISNPHKKGEHVFNDIAGSLENALRAALQTERANSLVLVARFGGIGLQALPQTNIFLDQIRRDSIFNEARTVVAPATGVPDDLNSRKYGEARLKLERVLAEMVVAAAGLAWKKKPRANSSFHEFEAVVAGLRSVRDLRNEASDAVDRLIDAAYDPQAEAGALAEPISTVELARRKAAIARMKEHMPALTQTGHSLVSTLMYELEEVLERRVAAA